MDFESCENVGIIKVFMKYFKVVLIVIGLILGGMVVFYMYMMYL